MGGLGSGRPWGLSNKEKIERYCSLDIRFLKRKSGLLPGQISTVTWSDQYGNKSSSLQIEASVDFVNLKYRYRDDSFQWCEIDLPIKLTSTSCNLGGKRTWFLCPIPTCRNRVAILYLNKLFVCRKCLQLVYESQYEDEEYRLIRKMNKIRDKLGWQHGILAGKGVKPKGMHQKTYNRLESEYDLLIKCYNSSGIII